MLENGDTLVQYYVPNLSAIQIYRSKSRYAEKETHHTVCLLSTKCVNKMVWVIEYEPCYSFLGFGKRTSKELNLNVIPRVRIVEVMTYLDQRVTILAKHGMMLLWIQVLTKWFYAAQQRICLAHFTYSTLRTIHLTRGFHFLRRYSNTL